MERSRRPYVIKTINCSDDVFFTIFPPVKGGGAGQLPNQSLTGGMCDLKLNRRARPRATHPPYPRLNPPARPPLFFRAQNCEKIHADRAIIKNRSETSQRLWKAKGDRPHASLTSLSMCHMWLPIA